MIPSLEGHYDADSTIPLNGTANYSLSEYHATKLITNFLVDKVIQPMDVCFSSPIVCIKSSNTVWAILPFRSASSTGKPSYTSTRSR